ncbi:MAG TPA: hypothetical protein EYP17_08450 [Candidatus Latescibacteria bacterium]|nr:hypothetical protein [Candidatus Latescibacterota bacterium]
MNHLFERRDMGRMAGMLACTFLGAMAAESSFSMLPTHPWYTLETAHFRVHYPKGWKGLAWRIAWVAEGARGRVVEFVGTDPGKVDIVVNPYTDFSNGYAALLPTHIGLFPTFPQGKWAGTKGDWLEMLIAHEYTHIAHMHTAEGLTWLLRTAFGEVGLLPNLIVPIWLVEGLAVYSETVHTRGGRGRNPHFEMKFRTPILEGRPWGYDQIGHYGRIQPPPDRPYIGGYYMLRRMVETSGERSPPSLLHEHSIFPLFPIDWDLTVYHGRPGWSIWREVVSEVLEGGRGAPGTSARRLTHSRDTFYCRPQWDSQGRYIYAYRTGYDVPPAVVRVDVEMGREEVVLRTELTTGGSFALSGEELYFARLRPHPLDDSHMLSDLYRYDLRTQKVRRLSRGFRGWAPSPSPDGSILLCVRNEGVYNNVWLIGLDGGSWLKLTDLEDAAFSSPAWSPDGRWIAASVNLRGYQDIYLLSTDGSQVRPLFVDEPGDFDPCWSQGGRYILFGSDRTGVHNVYAYDLKEGRLYRLTDVGTGAFEPSVSPDGGTIAYLQYNAEGMHIYLLEWDRALWEEVPTPQTVSPPASPEVRVAAEVRPYRGARQLLRPLFWLPLPDEDERGFRLGIYTARQDVLARHTLGVLMSWGFESRRPGYQVSYRRRVGYPILGISVEDWAEGIKGVLKDTPDSLYWARDRGARISVEVPISLWVGMRQRGGRLEAGLVLGRLLGLKLPEGYEGSVPEEGEYRGSFGEVAFWDVEALYRDLVPSRLTLVDVGWTAWGRYLGGEVRASEVHGTMTRHLPLGSSHHLLKFRIGFGVRSEGSPFAGFVPVPRGYPEGELGRRAVGTSLEYDFPLWYIDRGLASLPFFLEGVSGAVFADWSMGQGGRRYSFGTELRAHTVLFYRIPVYVGAGIARRSDGRTKGYPVLGIGYPGVGGKGWKGMLKKLSRLWMRPGGRVSPYREL